MIRIPFIWILLSVAFLISGCVGPSPSLLERDYGTSVKFSRSDQILDQEAGKNLEPVTGLDGRAAQTSMEKYRKIFEEAPQASQYILQLGGQK